MNVFSLLYLKQINYSTIYRISLGILSKLFFRKNVKIQVKKCHKCICFFMNHSTFSSPLIYFGKHISSFLYRLSSRCSNTRRVNTRKSNITSSIVRGGCLAWNHFSLASGSCLYCFSFEWGFPSAQPL